jgi:hypothetical protein
MSEFAALAELSERLADATGNAVVKPVRASIHPCAANGAICRACMAAARILIGKRVDVIVILIDREDRDQCPGAIAQALANACQQAIPTVTVEVVVKNRTFENWLVSDIEQLAQHRARFKVSRTAIANVNSDKADHVNGLALLKAAAVGASYDKVSDSKSIMRRARLERMGANSRSFRRFLRVMGHPCYQQQSTVACTGGCGRGCG